MPWHGHFWDVCSGVQWFAEAILMKNNNNNNSLHSQCYKPQLLLLPHHRVLKRPRQALDLPHDWLSPQQLQGRLVHWKVFSRASCLDPLLVGSFRGVTVTAQWRVETCCIGLFLLHAYCFFGGFVTQTPLLYFEWFIHRNEDLCLRAQCADIIQSDWAAVWLLRLH